MSESNSSHSVASKTPTHTVSHVRDLTGGKSHWTRIGSAWAHKDSKGFNIQLDAVPFDGRLVVRAVSEKPE